MSTPAPANYRPPARQAESLGENHRVFARPGASSDINRCPKAKKAASSPRSTGGKKRVTWPEVLRAVGRDGARSMALDQFRHSRFDADSFATRSAARRALAEALTRTEDWLEGNHPRWPERESIRQVRRRLELELWQ